MTSLWTGLAFEEGDEPGRAAGGVRPGGVMQKREEDKKTLEELLGFLEIELEEVPYLESKNFRIWTNSSAI